MDVVVLLKFVHVLAAIVAVGANFTYAPLLRLAGHERDRLVFTIEGVRWIDSRVANPAYIILLLAGIGMVLIGPYDFAQGWIAVSLVLYVVLAVIGIAVFSPATRRQLEEAKADPTSPAYAAAAQRTNAVGLLVLLIALVIVFLMVTKPF